MTGSSEQLLFQRFVSDVREERRWWSAKLSDSSYTNDQFVAKRSRTSSLVPQCSGLLTKHAAKLQNSQVRGYFSQLASTAERREEDALEYFSSVSIRSTCVRTILRQQ